MLAIILLHAIRNYQRYDITNTNIFFSKVYLKSLLKNLKVEGYLLGNLKFNCNSMSYQATKRSAVK